MVVKVYISGISGNKEVKKRQQRVLLILDSRNIKYEIIDIAEPGNEEQKDFIQNNSTSSGATISDPNPRHPLPPQIFNDDVYCGDYDQFDMANEVDEMEKFLKLAPDSAQSVTSNAEIKLGNGEIHENEKLQEPETKEAKEETKDEIVPENDETKEEITDEQKTNDAKTEIDADDKKEDEKVDEGGDNEKEVEEGTGDN